MALAGLCAVVLWMVFMPIVIPVWMVLAVRGRLALMRRPWNDRP